MIPMGSFVPGDLVWFADNQISKGWRRYGTLYANTSLDPAIALTVRLNQPMIVVGVVTNATAWLEGMAIFVMDPSCKLGWVHPLLLLKWPANNFEV